MAVTNADILGWLNANPGASDELIAQTMQEAGVSPAQMAQATGTNVAEVASRYEAALAPATTVADLYREVLGREPDPEGLAFWSQGFGDKVDAAEKASFLQAASSELANRSVAEQKVLAPNFDSVAEAQKAAAQAQADAQAKAQADAQAAAAKQQADAQAKAQADAAKATTQTAGIASLPATTTPKVTNADILGWFNANPDADAATISKTMKEAGVSGDQVSQALVGNKEAAQQYLTAQILSQGTASQWSGQGHGSAEANARDMAKIIADTGATDIKDFGKVTQYAPVQEIGKTYNGQQVITTTDEEGKTVSYIRQPTGAYQYDYETGQEYPVTQFVPVPADAKLGSVYGQYDGYETVTPVDQSKITFKDGQAVVAVGETFGNKATGQAVANTYSERQTGNAFGGTFAGKGNTGYRVQFAADGSPIFYTTGASSSDVGDLAPFLAIASFIPGVAPFAQAINAAIAIDNGDILGGLASLAGAGGFTDAATGLRVASALDKGDIGGLVTSLVNNPSIGALANTTMLTDTISLADAGNAINVICCRPINR